MVHSSGVMRRVVACFPRLLLQTAWSLSDPADGYVYALEAERGSLLWRHKTDGYVLSSPAVVSGVVYVGSYDNYIYALDAETGALLWSTQTGNRVFSSPAVADGVVYVSSRDHDVYALDAATGAPALAISDRR